MINQERLKSLFLDLVQIGSHSRQEREVAEFVRRRCEEMGGEVEVDTAGAKVGGNTGNVIARFRGTLPDAPPLLLSAHLDTVMPGEHVRPVVEGDIVRSDGTTILGGDDKSGVAVILEILRSLQEQPIPHTGVEAVFSICEEVGLLGAKHLDRAKLQARYGIVFDSDDPDLLLTRGPSSNRIEFKIHGLEAHAGVAPEQGISAIKIAAEAITRMRLGRIDEETTANIGRIEGGKATNVIPNLVLLQGEARSLSEAKLDAQTLHMRECVQEAAGRYQIALDGKTIHARVEETIEVGYAALNVAEDSPAVQLVIAAGARLGRRIRTAVSGGGCDANVFNHKGIQCANLGTGMRAIHTVGEWIDIKDMCAAARLGLEVLRINGERVSGGQRG